MLGKGFDACPVRGQHVVSMAVLTMTLMSPLDNTYIVSAAQGSTISVSNVEELYAVLNDAANEGAEVALAPGVYTLSATDPGGTPRPNRGRLELKADMSLYGVAGDRAAVVIDASLLPDSSFTVPFGRTGIIRAGLGSSAIEWLTIAGQPFAAAAIETDLVQTGSAGCPDEDGDQGRPCGGGRSPAAGRWRVPSGYQRRERARGRHQKCRNSGDGWSPDRCGNRG